MTAMGAEARLRHARFKARPGAPPGGAPTAAVAGRPEGPRGSALPAGFESVVQRLEQLVDLETRLLSERKAADLQDFSHRKRHALLELTQVLKTLDGTPASREAAGRLGALRAKLDRNGATLLLHLRAVQEVASIIARALQDAESDGTYSIATAHGRRFA